MNMINNSIPRITASVTMAPITPTTAFEIPPPVLEPLPEELVIDVVLSPLPSAKLAGLQTPVLLPHALH